MPVNGKAKKRVDDLDKCGYDNYWKDFDLVMELGIQFLRYGPPIYTTYPGFLLYQTCISYKDARRLYDKYIDHTCTGNHAHGFYLSSS